MKPTGPRLLAVLLAVGLAGGWALATIVTGWSGRSLPLPTLAGAALWLLAIALFAWGSFVRPRVAARNRPSVVAEPMPALQAARIAVLSMAAVRMGAVVAGAYLGIVLSTLVGGLSTPAAAQAFWSGLLAATGAAATSGVALWIERACVLPAGEDDDQ